MSNYFTPVSYRDWHRGKRGFADRIGQSFRETGFAVISDHSVDQGVIAEALDAAKAFFALPMATKLHYHDHAGGRQRGYTPLRVENARGNTNADDKEFWHTGRALPADSRYRHSMKDTPGVTEIAGFDTATRALYAALDQFGIQILRALALHLDLSETWFDDTVVTGNSILRLLHYPPQDTPPPAGSVRAGAHEDINVITLLLGAEEAGLQVLHRSGKWLDINPPAGSIVINIGDMLQRLTAGLLPSTTHRVLNPAPERTRFPRFSMPFFLHFNQDFMIEALPQCTRAGGTPQPPISAQAYLEERLHEIGLMQTAQATT